MARYDLCYTRGVDFSWTSDQLRLKDRIVTLAQERLSDDIRRRDREGLFRRELWAACGEAGLLGLNVSAEFGGMGCDVLTTVLALEGLGYGCRDRGLAFAVSAHDTTSLPTIEEFGSNELKQRFLPGLCAGSLIAAYAVTERAAGSDVQALQCTARRTERGYVLDGEKAFITFAPVADVALVYASTDPSRGKWGLSLFLVECKTPGYEAGPAEEKMGLRTVPIGAITLRDCEVPANHRIGPEGAGTSIFNRSQEWERIAILACEIGAMQAQLEGCIRFARERQASGQPIGRFQAVANRLVQMKLRLETSRLLTYQAAWLKQQGQPVMMAAALAKLQVSESYLASSIDAVRIHGARGYLTEYEVERDLRDAAAGPIYGGTSDIQHNIVARLLGL
jgi:alkylation response protein AidB-like acyl-CoA dehydrogenase